MPQTHFQPPLTRFAHFNVPWYRLDSHAYAVLQQGIGPKDIGELEFVVYKLLDAGAHFYVVEQMMGIWTNGFKRREVKKYIKWSAAKIKRERRAYNLPDPPSDKAEQFYCRLLYAFGYEAFQGSLTDLAKEFQLEPDTLRRYFRLLRQRQQLRVTTPYQRGHARVYEVLDPQYKFEPEEEEHMLAFYKRLLSRYSTRPFQVAMHELATLFGLSPYTVRGYVKELRQRGLITTITAGKRPTYRLERVPSAQPVEPVITAFGNVDGLSFRASRVYQALRAARGTNTVFAITYAELKELTGLAVNTVRVVLDELERQGYLWRKAGISGGEGTGRGRPTNQYLLYDLVA